MTQIHLLLNTTFMLSMMGISTNRKHMMSMLLCIETMTLILFVSMTLPPLNNLSMAPSPIIMIAMGACEAAAGLTLVTIATQKNTNDHVKNLNLLKC